MVVLLVAALGAGSSVSGATSRWSYWSTVVLVSVVGTLVSDNLVDNLGVSLWTTTVVFAVGLAATFIGWWRSERTLSIHSITTRRREGFYWAAILAHLRARHLGRRPRRPRASRLGYVDRRRRLRGRSSPWSRSPSGRAACAAVTAFWVAYVLTRPFGASIGDLLTADPAEGGLGLGTNATSALFLARHPRRRRLVHRPAARRAAPAGKPARSIDPPVTTFRRRTAREIGDCRSIGPSGPRPPGSRHVRPGRGMVGELAVRHGRALRSLG